MNNYDVIVIGGGPAGLAAAISAHDNGASVLLIERESRLGGILKQCIHDGFGLVRFQEKLSGPEYAEKFIDQFYSRNIDHKVLAFVTNINNNSDGYTVSMVCREGVVKVTSRTIILATGCRERTAKQVSIHGTRPSGVFTAGSAQNFVNLLGQLPTKKCVILGSGDIGLIMARRLTLEGAEVVGVYEAKSTPSGLTRNIHQCLHDYNIPLHLSHTVTRVFGHDRLTAVEIMQVDNTMTPISGTASIVECDSLILSVGLIPENEIAETLNVPLDRFTRGPVCDGQMMTNIKGIFTCGNATHVNDLVDYVSESADIAGKHASSYNYGNYRSATIFNGDNVLYCVPQQLNVCADNSNTVVYYRTNKDMNRCRTIISVDGKVVLEKKYITMRPPEMERLVVDFDNCGVVEGSVITISIREEEQCQN